MGKIKLIVDRMPVFTSECPFFMDGQDSSVSNCGLKQGKNSDEKSNGGCQSGCCLLNHKECDMFLALSLSEPKIDPDIIDKSSSCVPFGQNQTEPDVSSYFAGTADDAFHLKEGDHIMLLYGPNKNIIYEVCSPLTSCGRTEGCYTVRDTATQFNCYIFPSELLENKFLFLSKGR